VICFCSNNTNKHFRDWTQTGILIKRYAKQDLRGEVKVTFQNFGTFYIDVRHSGTVFKFNPSQKWKALFGWASSYRGKL
jgi:hypothetical protein